MEKFIREMAVCLLSDRIACEQDEPEEGDNPFKLLPKMTRPQEDICETVPEVLKEAGVTLDRGIEALAPELEKLIAEVDRRWDGKLTMAELAGEFGENMYVSLALSSVGHGISLEDDPEVSLFIAEKGCEAPDHLYISDVAVYNAVDVVRDELIRAMA